MSNALCDGVWHTGNCDFFRQKSRGLVKLGAIRFIDSRANAYAERGASEFKTKMPMSLQSKVLMLYRLTCQCRYGHMY